MKATRGTRIFGCMMLFSIAAAVVWGERPHAGFVAILGMILGGFAGECFHQWRETQKDG